MKRVITALILAPAIVAVVLWGPMWLFYALVATVAGLCYYEYAGIAARFGFGELGPIGYGAGLVVLVAPEEAFLAAVLLAAGALAVGMRAAELRTSLPRAALLVTGVLYIFGCFRFAIPIRAANPHWLMWCLLINWLGDTGAYYVGRKWGRHRMAPRVSPGKTWEGAAASVASAMAAGVIYGWQFLPGVPLAVVAILAAVVNAVGQLGDLAESAIKRGANVKDSGNLLPGHGGMLDRVDSTLFALPVLYACLRLMA